MLRVTLFVRRCALFSSGRALKWTNVCNRLSSAPSLLPACSRVSGGGHVLPVTPQLRLFGSADAAVAPFAVADERVDPKENEKQFRQLLSDGELDKALDILVKFAARTTQPINSQLANELLAQWVKGRTLYDTQSPFLRLTLTGFVPNEETQQLLNNCRGDFEDEWDCLAIIRLSLQVQEALLAKGVACDASLYVSLLRRIKNKRHVVYARFLADLIEKWVADGKPFVYIQTTLRKYYFC